MKKLLRKFRMILNRGRFESELSEEMEFHRSMAEESGLAEGSCAGGARCREARQFGNAALVREVASELWRFTALDSLSPDLHYGVGQLRRALPFTAVAVLALGVGLGINVRV